MTNEELLWLKLKENPPFMNDDKLEQTRQNFIKPPAGNVQEGDVAFTMTTDLEANIVRVQFLNPVAWIAFPPAFAKMFAEALLERAKAIEDNQGNAPPGSDQRQDDNEREGTRAEDQS